MTEPVPSHRTTEDSLLGGRLRLLQPETGYRVAIDAVLLAAAVPANDGERVMDAGSGVGATALGIAFRVPGARVTGLEIQSDLALLARRNARANVLEERVGFVVGDILAPPLVPASFDHVVFNPPYLEARRARRSPHPGKAVATVEGEATLADWIRAGIALARPRGTVTLINRADRLPEILAAMVGPVGDVTVLPLWPKPDGGAKRVIVQGRKGVAGPFRLLSGLVLHGPDGHYTAAAQMILREGTALGPLTGAS